MQINKIQNNNYNSQFKGILKIQNLVNGKITEQKTSIELDKGLAQAAIENIFECNQTYQTEKYIKTNKLTRYAEIIKQTLGINVPKINKEFVLAQLKNKSNRYSINVIGNYKITHVREDYKVLE